MVAWEARLIFFALSFAAVAEDSLLLPYGHSGIEWRRRTENNLTEFARVSVLQTGFH